MTTTQRGSVLNYDNLQQVLDASPDGARLGQQQFYTPETIAEMLARPLTPYRRTITDFQSGRSDLLKGARNGTTENMLGIEIDPRARRAPGTTIIGDCAQVTDLLRKAEADFDLLVLNPPFGIRWPGRFLPPAIDGSDRKNHHAAFVDSTYATWLIAHHLISGCGEGYMIANARTVDRLIVPCPAYGTVWARLNVPSFFENISIDMELSVIYFAADHTRPGYRTAPETVTLESPDERGIERACNEISQMRGRLLKGSTVNYGYMASGLTMERWEIVRAEWRRRQDEAQDKLQHNIWMHGGEIRTHVTPFQSVSGEVSRDMATELHRLNGKKPMQLVVMKDTRLALLKAIRSDIWRVDPQLPKFIDTIVRRYHQERAPFSRPPIVQRIGWLDEEDEIKCVKSLDDAFDAGTLYSIESTTFTGTKIEKRPRAGTEHKEEVLVSGEELMLLISDNKGHKRAFTQFDPSDETKGGFPEVAHWHRLSDLIAHFEMPPVKDLAELQPVEFQRYYDKLTAMES